jgi:proteic killer suppression protein
MIQSFADSDTEQLFREEKNRRFHSVARVALRKLIQINRAGRLSDLSVPPGNRLEQLSGDLAGLHSVRINRQWRIVFRWTDLGPTELRITDYH